MYWLNPSVFLPCVLALGLVVHFILSVSPGFYPLFPYRATGSLVEAILFFIMVGWNGFLFQWETTLHGKEMRERLQDILDMLKEADVHSHVMVLFFNVKN